eukprot:TRINITY_DN4971_c0_g1_i3.p1 TRINITY_DN4971_c0_g1~~TRINITY_DN4971_c0_g1_i3.p1  ORF type:complete len:108 (-),score=2.16 TRINITY_DN4971_c0_g1_i3:32-355(-)
MRVLFVFRALHSKTRPPSQPFISRISRAFSNLQLPNGRPSFGIAFDIDGVILRGREPVGGSQFALTRLYDDCEDTYYYPHADSDAEAIPEDPQRGRRTRYESGVPMT